MTKPSFLSSTFSVVTLIVCVAFAGLCVWMKDVASLKEVVLLLLGGYGLKKGMETAQNGKHESPPLPLSGAN